MSAPTPPPAQPVESAAPPAQPAFPGRHPGKVGAGRHLLSVVVAVVATGLAYLALDYSTSHGLNRAVQTFRDGLPPWEATTTFVVGCALLLVAAGCGRVSALGPLVAGVLYGVLPGLFFLVKPFSAFRAVRHLPDLYDQLGFGITGYGPFTFGLVGALLLGTALAGRWR